MNRRRRVLALSVVLVVAAAYLGVQAAMVAVGSGSPASAGDGVGAENDTESVYERHAGNTLVGTQTYGDAFEGRALEVDENGNVVWEYYPGNSRVFDVELLENGNVLMSVATKRPDGECPERYATDEHEGCVQNRVLEIDYDTKETVWNHSWYDVFPHNQEVHDADRLANGNTIVADMGRNRVFEVAPNGTTVWSWSAREHLGQWSEFDEEYGGPAYTGPHGDWTHLNDVDVLENGNVQVSIRNFDVVVEIARENGTVVDVFGSPGNHGTLHEQHNPMRVEGAGTVLVADSENDRVVEYDVETGERVWTYSLGTAWPRDADRLPNGNTLIVDTFHQPNRVIEVNREGEIVWELTGLEMPYDADRLTYPEEPSSNVSGRELESRLGSSSGALGRTVDYVVSWSHFVVPPWMGAFDLLVLAVGVVSSLVVLADLTLGWRRGAFT